MGASAGEGEESSASVAPKNPNADAAEENLLQFVFLPNRMHRLPCLGGVVNIHEHHEHHEHHDHHDRPVIGNVIENVIEKVIEKVIEIKPFHFRLLLLFSIYCYDNAVTF